MWIFFVLPCLNNYGKNSSGSEQSVKQEAARNPQKAGEAFRLLGPFFSYEEISRGDAHVPYKVNYIHDDGVDMAQIKSYLFQKANTYMFKYLVELMETIDKVTEYIRKLRLDQNCLYFRHAADRKTYLFDADENFWRVCNYVPSVTYDTWIANLPKSRERKEDPNE